MTTKNKMVFVMMVLSSLLASDRSFPQSYEWPDSQPTDCPFPRSADITNIVFTGEYANYTGADTWIPMWAADGNCNPSFTDDKK